MPIAFDDMKEEIIRALQRHFQSRAVFALLFGSFAAGRATAESDVDVAVYLIDKPRSVDEQLDLLSETSELPGRRTDCIILNTADIIITMQALFNGELIINNDPGFFLDFKARKMSEYIDFKRDRKIIEDNLLRGREHA